MLLTIVFFVLSVLETRPVGKTCASPAVSDNGKEEEKEAEEEEGEEGARASVIFEKGGGGDLAH